MFLLLCASACLCVCVCMSMRVFRFICKCVSVFVSLFVSVRACACVYVFVPACSCFWDDFQIIFYQISGPLWKLFGGFLEVAASRQPWPLPSRVEFHFEPFSYTFLHASWNPSWRQDRTSWSQDGAKLPNLAPRCAQDGQLGT